MTYDDILKLLNGTVCHRNAGWGQEKVRTFVAGDLMSDILTLEEDHMVLVTSLSTDQTIRTADFVGAKAVILVNGKKPTDSLLALASSSDIAVLTTEMRMFDVCRVLGNSLPS